MSSCIDVSCQPVSNCRWTKARCTQCLAYRKHSTKVGKLRTLKQQQPQSHFSVHHGWKTDLKCAVGLGCAAVTSGWALPVGRRIDLHLAPGGFYRASRLGVLLEQPRLWVPIKGIQAWMPFKSHRSPCEGVLCCAACDAPGGAWPRRCWRCRDRCCQCFWRCWRSCCQCARCHRWRHSRWRSPHRALHLLGDAVPHKHGFDRRPSCSHLGPLTY